MDSTVLSWAAAKLLQELVSDHRHDISTGRVSYGNQEHDAGVLGDLDELDLLADQILSGMPA
jgi:hypothetical protein